jgi:hypothetical protein
LEEEAPRLLLEEEACSVEAEERLLAVEGCLGPSLLRERCLGQFEFLSLLPHAFSYAKLI